MSVADMIALREAIAALGKNFEAGMAKFTSLEPQLAAYEMRIKTLEASLREKLIKQADVQNENIPKTQWSWGRFGYAVAKKDWRHAKFEKEEIDKYQDYLEKTMTATNFGGGGALIPPQYVAELISFLRPALITSRLGVRLMTGLTGSPVMIPKLTAGATASWISPEGKSIPASDATTGQLNMTPKKVAALVKLSNDLNLLSNPAMDAAVREDIQNALQEALDTAFFQGSGVLGEPLGLLNWLPAITSNTYTATATPVSVIADFALTIKTVENAKGLTDNAKFAMNPTSYWHLAALSDLAGGTGTGRSVLQQAAVAAVGTPLQTAIFGYPNFRSTLVSPAGTDDGYFGNFQDAILGIWSTIEVAASTETSTAFEKDELWIRALMRADVGVRREASFAILKSIN